MIFESDHIGCEAGWRGFRSSCYFIPRDADGNRKTWGEARAMCEGKVKFHDITDPV